MPLHPATGTVRSRATRFWVSASPGGHMSSIIRPTGHAPARHLQDLQLDQLAGVGGFPISDCLDNVSPWLELHRTSRAIEAIQHRLGAWYSVLAPRGEVDLDRAHLFWPRGTTRSRTSTPNSRTALRWVFVTMFQHRAARVLIWIQPVPPCLYHPPDPRFYSPGHAGRRTSSGRLGGALCIGSQTRGAN